MTDITSLSATELSAGIHARRYACVSVVRAFLERIATINPVINAIVSLRDAEELLAEAAADWRAPEDIH